MEPRDSARLSSAAAASAESPAPFLPQPSPPSLTLRLLQHLHRRLPHRRPHRHLPSDGPQRVVEPQPIDEHICEPLLIRAFRVGVVAPGVNHLGVVEARAALREHHRTSGGGLVPGDETLQLRAAHDEGEAAGVGQVGQEGVVQLARDALNVADVQRGEGAAGYRQTAGTAVHTALVRDGDVSVMSNDTNTTH